MVRARGPATICRCVGLTLIAWMAAPLPAASQPARDAPAKPVAGSAAISGRLLIAGEREYPVRRARVTLESDVLAEPRLADSGTDGRYRFDQLPPGIYRVRAEKPGFVTWSFGARHAYDPGQPIQLASGSARTADIGLPRGAALEGRVVNQEGDGVANLVVSACRVSYGPYGRQAAMIKESRTDDLGRYRIHSLPAGDYVVQAAADPLDAFTQRQAPGTRPPGVARTYYPGTANLSEADWVTVAAARDAANLDFGLIGVPVAQLTVTVLDSSGKAPATMAARVQRVGAPPGEVRGAAMKNQVMFRGVPAGEFWVMAAATPASGAPPEYALTRASVAGSDAALTLRTSPALAGTRARRARRLLDGGSVVRGRPGARRIGGSRTAQPGGSAAPLPAPPVTWRRTARSSLKGVFGPMLFRLGALPAGWVLVSVRLGDQEIIDTPARPDRSRSRPRRPHHDGGDQRHRRDCGHGD